MGKQRTEALSSSEEPTWRVWLVPVPAIAAGVGAWAIDAYAKTSLGAWRYVFVVPLGFFAVSVLVMGMLLVFTILAARWSERRWAKRARLIVVAASVLSLFVEFAYRWDQHGFGAAAGWDWDSFAFLALALKFYVEDRRRSRRAASADVPSTQADHADDAE